MSSKQQIAQLSDAALAEEAKRVCLLEQVSPEECAYIEALADELKRRFVERRVWLGPGTVFAQGD
jgi:hypothetical protein